MFCGAAQTVTGSRHLISVEGHDILVDCGLFQGSRAESELNWKPFEVPPSEIEAAIITHAHLDHVGWLPVLVRGGFRGPAYATPATIGLAKISLPDSGRIQEEDAQHNRRHGRQDEHPDPLYTEEDAYAALRVLKPIHYDQMQSLPGGATFRFLPAGHILGSAFAEIYFANGERILMTGDLGRFDTPIIRDPAIVDHAEYLVIESTYGDRSHSKEDVVGKLESIVAEAAKSHAAVLIPSFSIGRTQELLYYIRQLQNAGKMPRMPIFLDSPMAVSATQLYADSVEEQDQDMKIALSENLSPLDPDGLILVRDREQSKALNARKGPFIIIAGSGMANGGRIVHHLLHRISDPNTIVVFTGYQADGTLGRRILEGAKEVRILGEQVPVRAQIEKLNALSAHAGQDEILSWLHGFKEPPKTTFLVHGEPPAQQALKAKIEQDLHWHVVIPSRDQKFDLG